MSATLQKNGFVNVASAAKWPSFLPQLPADSFLEHVWVQVLESEADPTLVGANTRILFEQELALTIPGLDAVALAIAAGPGDTTIVPLEVHVFPDFLLKLSDVPIALRLKQDLFKPMRRVNGSQPGQPAQFEPDTSKDYVEIVLASVTFQVDGDGNIGFEVSSSISLPPCSIADTGIVIEAEDIGLYLDANTPPPGKPAGWRGIHISHAALYLPGELAGIVGNLELTDAYIGNGGFSGTVSDTWTPALSAQLMGMDFILRSAQVTFVQNALTAASIAGQITLPFFDEPLDVDIAINLNGTFAVRLASGSGLLTLTKPDILSLSVESLGFEVAQGLFSVNVSGKITPLVAGLDWPTFQVKQLSIDSKGNVHLDGGWLDLPAQYALDFHGFQIEITKIGFGKAEDGGKWIGFSGGLKLVDGLSAGASVEGLRITWYDDGRPVRVTLNGVGVEFEVPDVVRFKGAISYRELPGDVHRFDGAITLELQTLGLEIDAVLVIGTAPGYTFFAIYLGLELPAGIPLWTTGLALYGMAGLFALNMAPNKKPEEAWYEIGGTTDWFHKGTPGVTDLKTKWDNENAALAIGGGITIGTLADNGFTFSGKVLLVLSFSGPILLIQGAANLLKERSSLGDEPIFRALAVLDFRAGTFLIGLDAEYKYDDSGALIDIHGGVEAFFSLADADAWHLYIGLKDPREKRIRAEIFQLFEANSYFMLDAHQLATGAWVGYDAHWSFGPLSVTIEAWIEGNAVVSWKPVHFHGDLWLHGKAALKVFGFGLGLSADARLAADVFDPFHILASLDVGIDLPWPLPDFDVTIGLEWGPEPTNPPLPLPVKEIAVEHFKVTTSWPLPRAGTPLLLPSYDNGGFLKDPAPSASDVAAQSAAPPPATAPVVPLDARPHITFGRAVRDPSMIGVNAQPVTPEWERIGDPAQNQGPVKVRYSVTEVALHKFEGGTWRMVARKGPTPNPAGVDTLFGSWAPVPAMPDGGGQNVAQNKLWLWSKTPFDYTRHSSRAWDDWFTGKFSGYPCLPAPPEREICCDFEDTDPNQEFGTEWVCPHDRGFTVAWLAPVPQSVTVLAAPVANRTHAFCFPPNAAGPRTRLTPNVVTVTPPEPARQVVLTVAGPRVATKRECVSLAELPVREKGPNPLQVQDIEFVALDPNGKPAPSSRVVEMKSGNDTVRGVDCARGLEVRLPCSADFVSVTLLANSPDVYVEAFGASGASIATSYLQGPQGTLESRSIAAKGIVRLLVHAPHDETLVSEVCYACPTESSAEVQAIGYDAEGNTYGPFFAQNGLVTIDGTEMTQVRVTSANGFCLVRICCTIGLSQAEMDAREEMEQHMRDELGRWSQTGVVLEAHRDYRLTVVTSIETADAPIGNHEQTEFAYFRTDGPPGLGNLSLPIGSQSSDEITLKDKDGNPITVTGTPAARPVLKGQLNDLTVYVQQTVPATVPAAGEKPPLPRPVFRGYDVGATFNEDYVDLMYRLDGRDLGLYLYDANNRPVRDAQGRLIVLANRWGHAENVTLTASDTRWITTVQGARCGANVTGIPGGNTLATPGQVLNPDTVYEARFTPLLLHETFASYPAAAVVNGPAGTLGRWHTIDDGPNQTPSRWEIHEEGVPAARYIIQTSNIWGGSDDGTDPVKPGALLLYGDDPALPASDPEQPGNWTDHRLTVTVRSTDDDAIGVVFRYQDATHYYRFSMDRQRGYRRLTRVVGAVTSVLAEDDFVYSMGQDYELTVEAVGASLRIYQDGALIFDATDASYDHGRIGLYCWADQGARFADVRVDDFRKGAPVVYRFKFTTSAFVDFFHHLHSFQDEVWPVTLDGGTDISAAVAQAVAPPDPPTPPTDAEVRAFDAIASAALGPRSEERPKEVQVTRIEQGGDHLAFLLETPEPTDWKRTRIAIARANPISPTPELPGTLKLTDATFGTSQADEESVTVLARDAIAPTGHRIELREMPGPLTQPAGDPVLFGDDFGGRPQGALFTETFGPNALDHYSIVDEGHILGPSVWTIAGGHLRQSTDVYGGSWSPGVIDKPGTMAITGDAAWDDIRVRAGLRSTDDDAIGIVFRYKDINNYYRFSMDSQRGYRRLVKKVAGTFSTLWEDGVAYNVGQLYGLELAAVGNQLTGYMDGELLFSVTDRDLSVGQIGLYCWGNTGAQFESLRVESARSPLVLWEPQLADMSELRTVTPVGAVGGPAAWSAAGGALQQTSPVRGTDATPLQDGTYTLGGSPSWEDVTLSVRMRSDTNHAIGVLFRYQDDDNYYRFSMDGAAGYRRLIKRAAGVVTVLWQDAVAYTAGSEYVLTLHLVGGTLAGTVNGAALFAMQDGALKRGQMGFYCRENSGAHFTGVVVTDASRTVGDWTIVDEGTLQAPSVWRKANGMLRQSSSIHGVLSPANPGTLAIAGQPSWADYRLRIGMRSDTGQAIGVVFRYQDSDNYYRLSFDAAGSYRRLIKRVGGVVTVLWADAVPYTVGNDLTITVDAIGSRLVAYQDGTRLFAVDDNALLTGMIGAYTSNNPGARFTSAEVSQPPLEAYALFRDRFGSNDVSDWTFSDQGAESAPSVWTTLNGEIQQSSNIYSLPLDPAAIEKPGTTAVAGDATWSDVVLTVRLRSLDDDACGVAFRYQDADNYYRFSMDSQRGYRRLVKNVAGVFTSLWEDDTSYEVGKYYDLTIAVQGGRLRGYLDGVPLFTVSDGDLSAGRIGLYAWADQDVRFSHVRVYPAAVAFDGWLLDDPFDALAAGRWTIVDEGNVGAPSDWSAANGEMRQQSDIHGGDPAPNVPDKPGTMAVAGDARWADYRVSARLTSDTDGGVGLVFRYKDASSHYRFSMDRAGSYRRLVKKVGGTTTTLWEDAVQYAVGRDYVVTIDCVGDRLIGYVNGAQLFAVFDSAVASGRVGLYSWSNTGARFADLRVAEPVWTTLYRFGSEETMPAGTRVRVFSGNEAAAPAPEAGVIRRFVADLDDPGRLHFTAAGADLRLRAPHEQGGHSRRFLADGAFALAGARVLRKADGTGLVVVVPAGTAAGTHLDAGQYRLQMTYSRDIRANDPTAQVLSENGDTGSEKVTLEMPWRSHG